MAAREDIPEHLKLTETLQVPDPESLQQVCRSIIDIFKPGMKTGLIGPLGAGKTFFVKVFCKEKGISQEEVVSPSYTIMHEYLTEANEIIQHWDLYRLGAAPDELFDPYSDALHFIEWADRSTEVMELLDILLIIRIAGEGRIIDVYQAIT